MEENIINQETTEEGEALAELMPEDETISEQAEAESTQEEVQAAATETDAAAEQPEEKPVKKRASRKKKAAEEAAEQTKEAKAADENAEDSAAEEQAEEDTMPEFPKNNLEDSLVSFSDAKTSSTFVTDRMEKQYREDNEENKNRERWLKVLNLKNRKAVVESVILAVELSETGSTRIITTVEGFNVVISDSAYFVRESFRDDYFEVDRDEQSRRRYEMARSRIGSKVSFVIISAKRVAPEDEYGEYAYVVAGSRTQAMAIKQNRFFYSENPVKAGACAEAKILSVGESIVTCEVLGVECIMNNMELDLMSYIPDCRKVYAPGDVLRVCIMKVHYNTDEEGNPLSIRLNISAAALQQHKLAECMDKIKEGSSYLGTVRSYRADRKTYTIALDCKGLVFVHEESVIGRDILLKGDKVSVTIRRKRDSYANGTAKKLNARI